jgi:hypothetical protein
MAQSQSIKREKWIRLSLSWLVILLVSTIIIYPLVWTVGASLNAGNSLLSSSIIPENLSFQHYADLFNGQVNYMTWYWNSMKISFMTMVLTLISVSFTAYAFSRFRFKGRQNGLMLFLLLQLLGGLMKALFARGITLVATSNIPPDDLYRNGLQRARFLPAIDAIKQHCDIMNVDAGVDYRLRTLTQAHLWLSPLNDDTRQQMDKLWLALAGTKRENAAELEINHRPLATLGMANQTLAASFSTLCVEARSQHDYIALSRLFHTVMLFDVPVMTTLMGARWY